MGNEDKPNDLDAERQEHRISLEKDAAKLDAVPGADDTQKALYAEFATKDEAWKNEMDKKLVRKIDGRLLPILIVLYLLNFLDRYVFFASRSDIHMLTSPTAPIFPKQDKAVSNAISTCTAPTST